MASLPELQARFSAAVRGDPDALACEVSSGGHRRGRSRQHLPSNSLAMFEGALERTYPVLRRRVGDDYFHQLARGYRARHPSRSGDLHWIGEHFPGYVAHTETGTGYEWLAELAALEWACETALVARQEPAVGRRRWLDCRRTSLARPAFASSPRSDALRPRSRFWMCGARTSRALTVPRSISREAHSASP
jgi:hypothetical protein